MTPQDAPGPTNGRRPVPDIPQDLERRATARERVLAALEQAGPRGVRNVELCQPDVGGLRAIGRVHELRRDWAIETRREGGGVYRYMLRGPRQVGGSGRIWTGTTDRRGQAAAPVVEAAPGWLF